MHFRHKILPISKASRNVTSHTRKNGGSKGKISIYTIPEDSAVSIATGCLLDD
jgi:hypothetical protein